MKCDAPISDQIKRVPFSLASERNIYEIAIAGEILKGCYTMLTNGEWAVGANESITPYEIGGGFPNYPVITVHCSKGDVEVKFITDGADGIQDGTSGTVTRRLESGNDITRKARAFIVTAGKDEANGTYTVEK
ncbi:hypothetical protein [Mesorhizobium sp. IMUNJ 23232]|uniref:hypothetical protein n=1 Tax=Mesorhizobium sp. IMUNJ 23232 TaxID=3376064 RepID=UPI0037A21028